MNEALSGKRNEDKKIVRRFPTKFWSSDIWICLIQPPHKLCYTTANPPKSEWKQMGNCLIRVAFQKEVLHDCKIGTLVHLFDTLLWLKKFGKEKAGLKSRAPSENILLLCKWDATKPKWIIKSNGSRIFYCMHH